MALWPAQKKRPISGKWLVLVILLSLAVPTLAFPTVLDLPVWIEMEIVVGGWAVVGWCTLATLLYRGWTIQDDYLPAAKPRPFGRWDYFFLDSLDEGLLGVIGSIVASIFLISLLCFVFEMVLPFVALVIYSTILKMLRTAAHDQHECEGNLSKAVLYGGWWSALYTTPLMVIVYGTAYVRHWYLTSLSFM